jgi:uncharacterized membrane protein YdjX (TVP38/TMEM64 family)
MRRPLVWGTLLGLILLAGLAASFDLIPWRYLITTLRESIADHPLLYFLGLVILPGLGLPSTPLFLLAGVVLAPILGFWGTAAVVTAALGLNILWTHLLAAGPGRRGAAWLIERKNLELPSLSEDNRLMILILIRLSPWIPLPLQNYAIGLSGVPLSLNLLIGVPAQAIYAVIFLLFGEALYEGKENVLAVLIFAIISTVFLAYYLKREIQDPPKGT